MTRLSLPIESYDLRSVPASTSRLLNCFPEALPPEAKTPFLLSRAPGVVSWSTVGNGPIYALHSAFGLLYVISGSKLYEVDRNKTATLLGDIGTVGNLDIDSNTDTVVVVNEPAAFYWDGTTFGQITDADFTSRGAGDVEFADNFLVFREPNSGRFFCADLATATSFDALDFATSEGSPDNLVGMKSDHLEILNFGEESVEIWAASSPTGFPFERQLNGFIELGCLAGRTIAKLDQSVIWVASDFSVRRLSGVTAVRISTHAVEQFLTGVTTSTLNAWTYSQDGHLFYVLTCSEGTRVYDAVTEKWHERSSYGSPFWKAGCHAQAFDFQLVGDSTSNRIGYLDPFAYDEYLGIQRMEWVYQPIYSEQRLAFHDRLEIVLEAGTGLTTGQGSDPQVMLDISDDGGSTWRSAPNKHMGARGERRKRVVWHALGAAEQRVYRASVSDPVRVTVTDTLLDVRGGRL